MTLSWQLLQQCVLFMYVAHRKEQYTHAMITVSLTKGNQCQNARGVSFHFKMDRQFDYL